MTCSHCGSDNPAGKRFCGDCGGALENRCPQCGADHPPNKKFCGDCGASFAPQPARATDTAEARKVVTIVFADLVGSTALHERLDAESVRRFMGRYYEAMRGAVDAEGGTVTQLLGDGVMAVFGAPRVAEDDAIRAVRAAVGMQQAFRALADAERGAVGKTGLRIAVNTGEVVASDQSEIIGDPVNVAARLQDQGGDGDVVIGEATRRLVSELVTLAPLGTFALKGRAETVAAYRVVSLERPAGAPATAFVGREDELGRLTAVYETAVTARRARLAVILGSPGLGKSRLLAELARRLGDGATVLSAHCDATGGATFAPIAEALRAVLRLDAGANADTLRAALDAVVAGDDAERSRIATGIAALLAGTPAPPEETFFVVRRFLGALAVAQPVLLVLDDLQWAEPLLLDLTEHLVQWSTTVPLLILVAARPELRDVRSSLATPGGLVAEVVTLAGLDAGAATRLAANVIGAGELPAAIAGRVLAASEGNPLFVGELVRMLVHDGALKREGDRWTAGVALATLEMPPTIHALLAARLERLGPEERIVLERAAVIGRQFSRAALAHLLPRDLTNLNARLESLRRSELVESDSGWFLGEPVLRFHHVLIRDAAYRRVLKGTRAELHGRFADWLESRVGETIEHDELIGWHLEQAHQYLRELGPIDDSGRVIGERAARYLAAAGRRALERDDVPLAASLLGRALERLDAADPTRAELALDWCEALLAVGDVGPAAGAIAELGRFIAGSERLRAWHTCFAGQHAALTDPQALHATADAVAAAAETLAALGDGAGEAKAHAVHAYALARLGKVGACEAALDRALAAARRANDRRRANGVLAGAPLAALWGPSPVTRASGRCLDVVRVLRITQGAPAVEAVALRCQAVLEALRGRTEAARRMIASSRHLVEELGITQRLLEADVFAGLIELLEGDAAAAERSLRTAYEGLRQHGLGIDAAQAAALLGRALLAQGRAAEAETLSQESESLAGDDLQAAMAWRCVRAEALARRGEHVAAVEFARAAVDLAAATDALLFHADARLALAAALRAAGRSDQAAVEETRAVELWEAKGATLLAERAREAGRVEPAPPAASTEAGGAPSHRVRANAATAYAGRTDAAFAARDLDAFPAWLSDDYEMLDHPSGVAYDREAQLSSHRLLLRARDPTHRHEPLATLGDSLALCRLAVSARGYSGGDLDVGAYERPRVLLIEVDAQGRARHEESFAIDHLGDAIARLYERYADLLPDGPAHDRAAMTARVVAANMIRAVPFESGMLAPDFKAFDHRIVGYGAIQGAREASRVAEASSELVADFSFRVDDVLALTPDALVRKTTQSGVWHDGGGAFESTACRLSIFDAAGAMIRSETFEADRDDEALARFDELTAEPTGARSAALPARAKKARERRVRPNAATAHAAREDAAFDARDADAFANLLADDLENVDHRVGTTFDRLEYLTSLRRLMTTQDLTRRHEPLATLGDTLALRRVSLSSGGIARGNFDVGSFEYEAIRLLEVDAQGRCRRVENFDVDRLGAAIVRLYERYAEILPDGPERTRAAATARSVAAIGRPFDLEGLAAAVAPAIECVDHRSLGIASMHGAAAFLDWVGTLVGVADDPTRRVDDLLSLRSDAFLVRCTTSGRDRAGGGTFEAPFILLCVFGTDGLVTRVEHFDVDRDDEALARFDELTGESATARIAAAPAAAAKKHGRRVRPNVATAHAARVVATMASRDGDALSPLLAADLETVHHPTGTVLDREGNLAGLHMLLGSQGLTFQLEPLATLGDALALFHHSVSLSEMTAGRLEIGALESEQIVLIEVDVQGRASRTEFFADDHLSDAVARLYERYAELLPDGPARARAVTIARSVAISVGPEDLDRFAPTFAPLLDYVDHRTIGMESTRSAEAFLQGARALHEVADDVANRVDDVLALRPEAGLLRVTNFGRARAGGGAYERPFLALSVFGADGLLTRFEQFDDDRDADALARFDELTGAPGAAHVPGASSRASERRDRRVRANAATANAARTDAALAARDVDALPALLADSSEIVDHIMGVTYDRRGLLATWRSLLSARDPTSRHEDLATLGDALALCRITNLASGFAGKTFDVGAYEREEILLNEVDAHGRRIRGELFATDRLGDAVVRLYERYAELLPDGPARARAAATARSIAAMLGPYDVDRYATAFAPATEYVDHRTYGVGPLTGVQAVRQWLGSLLEVAEDVANRFDDILELRSDGLLLRWTQSGTDRIGGGAFERHVLWLGIFGADALLTRVELFEGDRDAEALARFDELASSVADERPTAPATTVRIENAATRAADRIRDAWDARDWARFAALFPAGFRNIDRRRFVQLELDREQFLAGFRPQLQMASGSKSEVLATRGNRLAMLRTGWELADHDIGRSEIDIVIVGEVDEHGDIVTMVQFEPDDLDAAYAELQRRFLAGEAAAFTAPARWLERFQRARGALDAEIGAYLAPDFLVHDHSPLGWGTLDRSAYIESMRALNSLSPDVRARADHLWLSERGLLAIAVVLGTHEGGAFEQPRVMVSEVDSNGRELRRDLYSLDQLDDAKARFAAIGASATRDPLAALARPNAASAAGDRWVAAYAARDWAAMRALYAPDAKSEDRRRLVRLSLDVDWRIGDVQRTASMGNTRVERQLVGTAGDRVAIERALLTGDPGGAAAASATEGRRISNLGPFEIEFLEVVEVDESGRITGGVMFDVDDWRAATREAFARWFARDAVAAASVGPAFELFEAMNEHDRTRLRPALADDFVLDDHRPARLGLSEGADAWVESLAALWDLAPDWQIAPAGTLAYARYGSVVTARGFGTLAHGGTFENPTVSVAIVADGRIARIEQFEPEDVDAALARFAELRPDPLRIPPNAATRAGDRWVACLESRNWEAMADVFAPTVVFEDRRRLIRTTGGRDMAIANARAVAAMMSWRVSRTLLATAGDRLSLEQIVFRGGDDAPVEIATLHVAEVDGDGRFVAAIVFDPDDRRAASAELRERFARSDEARWMAAGYFEFARALLDRDLDRMRAAIPDDFVHDDHRRTGGGRLEGADATIAWMAALLEQSPDATIENLYIVATEKHATLAVSRTFGTLTDGGEFESVFVRLMRWQGDRFCGAEIFELEDLDMARVRFEELCAAPCSA